MKTIPALRPTADKKTKRELIKVIDSGWWGQGPKTEELERKFAEKVGRKYAIATNSCTSALDLCIKAYGITNGELITTPMTFVSDAIVGEWNGLSVTFADIDANSLCIAPEAIVVTDKTRVIIAVHSHGRLADIKRIRKKFKGLIIEDCAHACFTRGAGLMGDIAVWSFQAVKTLPCGDGGMITTNNQKIAQRIRNMSWLGVEKSTYTRAKGKKYSWNYDIIHGGIKAYMNDINAVIALGNLRRIEKILAKRMEIQRRYNEEFTGLLGVEIPMHSETCQYYTLKVRDRDKLSEYLAKNGITTSVHFKPLSEMSYWKKAIKNPLPVTEKVWPLLLSLPCHDGLTKKEQNYVIKKFKEGILK